MESMRSSDCTARTFGSVPVGIRWNVKRSDGLLDDIRSMSP